MGGGGDQDPQGVQGLNQRDCPFCAIARGEDDGPELIVDERHWLAFFPPDPATPGHTLVIPRDHFTDFWEAPPDVAAEVAVAAWRIGRALRAVVGPDGLNLISSAGAAAEQTVFHLHLHVVPRWEDDGFGAIWPPKTPSARERIADLGERLRAELGTS